MQDNFEVRKNTKAATYTAIICGLFLIIAILYTWPLQIPPMPTVQDLIEINLGNEKEGLGSVQPLVKGNPAPDVQSSNATMQNSKARQESAKDIQADEKDDADAAPVTKPLKIKDDADIVKETSNKPVKAVT